MTRQIVLTFFGGVLLALTGCTSSPAASNGQVAASSLTVLSIKSANGVHRFKVEMARTPEQQERGLMFRQSLPPDGGMLFPMDPPRTASFWMRNTVIPLDMIFIRDDGTIARIAAETTPYSEVPVDSGEPVAAVLEIAGGQSAALGIAEDDKVTWPR
jgi:uncharacterized protein